MRTDSRREMAVESGRHVSIQRFNLHQRLQHALMALSVLMLILTGFPIKYASQSWAQSVVSLFGDFQTMFYVHLTFGVVMLYSGAYHLAWLARMFISKGIIKSMLPTWKDLLDVGDHLKYLLGFSATPPRFGRYTWLEKFEYFAVIWGVIVMGASGAMLWFPQNFLWLPRWALDVTRVVHSNEAFVCMLAVFMGHFFAVHFNPKVFPTSKVWLSGKIGLEHLYEEHPLEYESIREKMGLPQKMEENLTGPAGNLTLITLELLLYSALVILLLYTFLPLLLK